MNITRDNSAHLGSQISFPPHSLQLVRGASVLPNGFETQIVSSYEPGRREGLIEPVAVKAMDSKGDAIAGVRIAVQIVNSSQGIVVGGENVTGLDGLARFNILKLRLPPGIYHMELDAADFQEVPPVWLRVKVRKCAPGEVAPTDAPHTCKLW